MSLRVGVIGAGAMGSSHVRTLVESVPAAHVTRVFDQDADRAAAAAATAGAEVATSATDLIDSEDVDAVVIASPDSTHARLALLCISAGKPVLCEKPLAVTAQDALEVVQAEIALGRRVVQVGFMRRYDPGFVELRRHVADGRLGQVRLAHAVHRNASSTTSTDDASLITGSMVHELDTIPWLLGDRLSAIRVDSPVVDGFRDPQVATLWTRGGVLVTVEVFVNAGYGYDVRCELVGTEATSALASSASVSTRSQGTEAVPVGRDFVAHFADAYRIQLGHWADAASTGTLDGPSAWDGYVANVAAEAGVAALRSGGREPIDPGARPALYDA